MGFRVFSFRNSFNDFNVCFTSSDSNKLKILEFPKQRDEIINARIEIDLSEGTKIIPLRDLLFLDLRVKGFFILIFIYNSFVLLKEL